MGAEIIQLKLPAEQQEQSLVAALHLQPAVPQLAEAEPLDPKQWGQSRQAPAQLLELLTRSQPEEAFSLHILTSLNCHFYQLYKVSPPGPVCKGFIFE